MFENLESSLNKLLPTAGAKLRRRIDFLRSEVIASGNRKLRLMTTILILTLCGTAIREVRAEKVNSDSRFIELV